MKSTVRGKQCSSMSGPMSLLICRRTSVHAHCAAGKSKMGFGQDRVFHDGDRRYARKGTEAVQANVQWRGCASRVESEQRPLGHERLESLHCGMVHCSARLPLAAGRDRRRQKTQQAQTQEERKKDVGLNSCLQAGRGGLHVPTYCSIVADCCWSSTLRQACPFQDTYIAPSLRLLFRRCAARCNRCDLGTWQVLQENRGLVANGSAGKVRTGQPVSDRHQGEKSGLGARFDSVAHQDGISRSHCHRTSRIAASRRRPPTLSLSATCYCTDTLLVSTRLRYAFCLLPPERQVRA